jgi:hypothetical protein
LRRRLLRLRLARRLLLLRLAESLARLAGLGLLSLARLGLLALLCVWLLLVLGLAQIVFAALVLVLIFHDHLLLDELAYARITGGRGDAFRAAWRRCDEWPAMRRTETTNKKAAGDGPRRLV